MFLQGEDGYFCKKVTVCGADFMIRELSDTALDAYVQALGKVKAALKLDDLPDGPLDKGMIEELLLSQNMKLTSEQVLGIVRDNKQAIDIACRDGLAAWDLGRDDCPPCTPENATRLSNLVKYRLSQEIARVSMLDFDEQDFT